MKEEIEKKIRKEQKRNWKEFKMWVKNNYPFMIDEVRKYDKKFVISDIVGILLHEFLYVKTWKYKE